MRVLSLGIAALAASLLLAASAAASGHIGDGRVTKAGPRVGWAYSCTLSPRPAGQLPWLLGGSLLPGNKPVVVGAARWSQAQFALVPFGSALVFASNALPSGAPSGKFPVPHGAAGWRYLQDAAGLAANVFVGSFPASPGRARKASCIDPSAPVAVATDGVPIMPAFTAAGNDAAAREVQDSCGGRTNSAGLYYYRSNLSCLWAGAPANKPSPLIGYARDGIPLYGPRGEHGQILHSSDLDACHGRNETVTVHRRKVTVYRYHVTPDFPYTIGCLRAQPSRNWRLSAAAPAAPASTTTTTPTPPVPPSTPAPLQISTSPALYPGFAPGVSDYVTRCAAGQPVNVQVAAPTGTTVSVDGQPAQGGSFSAPVTVASGQRFDVTVNDSATTTTYHVRCLPSDFPAFTSQRTGTPQAQWYIIAPSLSFGPSPASYVAFFDADGVPVWWMHTAGVAMDAKLVPDGPDADIAYAVGAGGAFGKDPAGRYEIHSLDGTLKSTLQTYQTTTDDHELQPLSNGDYLMESYAPRDHVDLSAYNDGHGDNGPSDATVLDGEIQELKPDGTLVWSWNSKDHISLDETGRWWQLGALNPNTLPDQRTAYDIVHLNSVESAGNTLLVSFRHLDAVYAIDRTTGNVLWKLGGTQTAQSLSIVGDPNGSADFGGQHDARMLPDGTVSVFDDGTARNRPPRDLRFRIDTTAKTATLIEQISDSGAQTSLCCGSARRLPGGDWVTSWGPASLVTEATPSGDRALSIGFAGGVFSYRAVPVLPGVVSADTLRQDMDVMNPRP